MNTTLETKHTSLTRTKKILRRLRCIRLIKTLLHQNLNSSRWSPHGKVAVQWRSSLSLGRYQLLTILIEQSSLFSWMRNSSRWKKIKSETFTHKDGLTSTKSLSLIRITMSRILGLRLASNLFQAKIKTSMRSGKSTSTNGKASISYMRSKRSYKQQWC